ncbi:MAG: hypothetical protein Ct9H300mP25_14430 [Acidobacteriota bacterium]|nr:MAG: hypothetical protein Ct9H300mP25_14430 [Acidobacteriota bacterium]
MSEYELVFQRFRSRSAVLATSYKFKSPMAHAVHGWVNGIHDVVGTIDDEREAMNRYLG